MKLAVLVVLLLKASASGSLACSFDSQVHALALNMYHEARGEGHDAMQLVGEVTLNRVQNQHFPDSVCGVVYQRKQFSWTYLKKDHTPHNEEVWQISMSIAKGLLDGSLEPLGTKATHYHSTSVRPYWARAYDRVGMYGGHIFYVMGDRL